MTEDVEILSRLALIIYFDKRMIFANKFCSKCNIVEFCIVKKKKDMKQNRCLSSPNAHQRFPYAWISNQVSGEFVHECSIKKIKGSTAWWSYYSECRENSVRHHNSYIPFKHLWKTAKNLYIYTYIILKKWTYSKHKLGRK